MTHCAGARTSLPSFPTRRSSDLRIVPGALEQFAVEWRETVAPARVAAGFSIVGPWLVPDESRFIWILGYDGDRKSTRLNSSHRTISYAVFCLKTQSKNHRGGVRT